MSAKRGPAKSSQVSRILIGPWIQATAFRFVCPKVFSRCIFVSVLLTHLIFIKTHNWKIDIQTLSGHVNVRKMLSSLLIGHWIQVRFYWSTDSYSFEHLVFWIQRVKLQGQKCELKRMASSRGYKMQRRLGSGHFGDVFLANKGGKSFAIKKVVNT